MRIFKELLFLVQLIPAVIIGWFFVFIRLFRATWTFFYNNRLIQNLVFFGLLFQFLWSIFPWMEYRVNFAGTTELIRVSVRMNLYFILLTFASFLFVGLLSIPHSRKVYFGIQLIIGGFYLSGLLNPLQFFVDFKKINDVQMNGNGKLFGVFCLYNFVLSIVLLFLEWKFKTLKPTSTQSSSKTLEDPNQIASKEKNSLELV